MHHFHAVDALEDCEEERDLLDDEEFLRRWADDVDAVTDVVGVLDEEEDAGAEKLLCCGCEDEREGEQRRSRCCKSRDEVGVLESDFGLLVKIQRGEGVKYRR